MGLAIPGGRSNGDIPYEATAWLQYGRILGSLHTYNKEGEHGQAASPLWIGSDEKVAQKNYLGGKRVSTKRCQHLSPQVCQMYCG